MHAWPTRDPSASGDRGSADRADARPARPVDRGPRRALSWMLVRPSAEPIAGIRPRHPMPRDRRAMRRCLTLAAIARARPGRRAVAGARRRPVAGRSAEAEVLRDFDVVIAGGTTAAFAAAVASAESGARTALIEPTDWVGGQLTASAVPAVDEAWHKVTDPQDQGGLQRLGDRPQAREHDAQLPGDARRHRQPRRRLGQQLLLPAQGLPRPAPPPARGEAQGQARRLPRRRHQVGRGRPDDRPDPVDHRHPADARGRASPGAGYDRLALGGPGRLVQPRGPRPGSTRPS